MKPIQLSVINTFWTHEKINKRDMKKHLKKFEQIPETEVLLCFDEWNDVFGELFLKYFKDSLGPLKSYSPIHSENISVQSEISNLPENQQEIQMRFEKFTILGTTNHVRAGGCRNLGLKYCSGRFVLFIDSYNDSLDSGNDFNLQNLLDILKEFLKSFQSLQNDSVQSLENSEKNRIKESDCFEISNRYNEFYRAMPWNIFWRIEFLREHNLKFIEWQGYEDFLFDFVFFKLNPQISIFLENSDELLTFSFVHPSSGLIKGSETTSLQKDQKWNFKISKCLIKRKTCYNHAVADTLENYGIDSFEKLSEGQKYIENILGYVPKEFIAETIIANIDSEFGKMLLKENMEMKIEKTDIFKYIFKNIEERFRNERYLQIPF